MNARVILLVEDNAQDEFLIRRSLTSLHPDDRVDVVRDGQQALDYLFREGEFARLQGEPLPVAVLLDIALPDISGHEVLARLRIDQRTQCLPVVILTSSDAERDCLKSYARGANGFVRKPLELVDLVEAVKHLGAYWLDINESPVAMQAAPQVVPGGATRH
jgi:CheY-like chemotaxis protein